QPIGSAAEPEVGRIDREGEHIEQDFARAGRSGRRDFGAAHDLGGLAVAIDQDGFQATPPFWGRPRREKRERMRGRSTILARARRRVEFVTLARHAGRYIPPAPSRVLRKAWLTCSDPNRPRS